MDILCHRGLWGKKESFQNSIESIIAAFKKGWGVEIDLRLNEKGDIYLAHDEEEDPKTYLSDLLLSKSLLSSIKEIPTMALHIKEDTDEMFKALCKIVNPTTKIIIFGLRQSSQEKYAEIFGWSKIAYELETGLIGTVRGAMNSKAGVIWLVERAWAMEAIEYIKLLDRKSVV